MGRPRKLPMVKRERAEDRAVTFNKRRKGLFNKASELNILCGAQVAIIAFDPSSKRRNVYSFSTGDVSPLDMFDGYINNHHNQDGGSNTMGLAISLSREIRNVNRDLFSTTRETNMNNSQLEVSKIDQVLEKMGDSVEGLQGMLEVLKKIKNKALEKLENSPQQQQQQLLSGSVTADTSVNATGSFVNATAFEIETIQSGRSDIVDKFSVQQPLVSVDTIPAAATSDEELSLSDMFSWLNDDDFLLPDMSWFNDDESLPDNVDADDQLLQDIDMSSWLNDEDSSLPDMSWLNDDNGSLPDNVDADDQLLQDVDMSSRFNDDDSSLPDMSWFNDDDSSLPDMLWFNDESLPDNVAADDQLLQEIDSSFWLS